MNIGSSDRKVVAVLIVREIPSNVPIDAIHRLHADDDNLRLVSAAFGRIVDVTSFDLSEGNSAADRFALAARVLNASADEFEAIQALVDEHVVIDEDGALVEAAGG